MECFGRTASRNWLCVCADDACDAKYITAGTVITTQVEDGNCGARTAQTKTPIVHSSGSAEGFRGLPVESCQLEMIEQPKNSNLSFLGRWRRRDSPTTLSPASSASRHIDTVVDVVVDDEDDVDLELAVEPNEYQRSRETVGQSSPSPAPGGRVRAPVIVNVYDLGRTMLMRGFNNMTKEYGAFHTGVEVYGFEWSFGMTADDTTGIWSCTPRTDPEHNFREAIAVGHTSLSTDEVTALLERIRQDWPGDTYNVLTRNCHHFTEIFCRELGCGPVPAWTNALATQSRLNWLEPGVGAASSEQHASSFFDGWPSLLSSVEMTVMNLFAVRSPIDDLPEKS